MVRIFKTKRASKVNRQLKSNLKKLKYETRKRQAIANKIF